MTNNMMAHDTYLAALGCFDEIGFLCDGKKNNFSISGQDLLPYLKINSFHLDFIRIFHCLIGFSIVSTVIL